MLDPAEQTVLQAVGRIVPFDSLERQHHRDVVKWISSGAPVFRVSKPDNPPKHLVSYFVPYDHQSRRLMLIDHVKAGLWLPPGGHIEPGEDPQSTVVREAQEELRIEARFDTPFGFDPLFITATQTKGVGTHTDVSLWYVIAGGSRQTLWYDEREMNGYSWFSLQEILAKNIHELDPHMHRFVEKMQAALSAR